jgi:hypothetical protein
MNFLKPPAPFISPYFAMTPEQLIAAEEFVDELVMLGTFGVPSVDAPVITNERVQFRMLKAAITNA